MWALSLCSGVGVLDLVAGWLYGAQVRAFAETDRAASAVLAARWPGVPNLGDVAAVDVEAQVVTCGWPCQPHALHGRGLGAADPRAIWPACRDAIERARPRVLMLENVENIRRNGEMDRVLTDLAALGFDAEWITYRACCSGAPHQRPRVFLLAADPEQGGLPARRRPDHTGAPAGAPWPDQCDGGDAARRAARVAGLARGWGRHAEAIERWERVTGREVPAPRVAGRRQGPFWEWMMGLPAGHLAPAGGHPAQLQLAGNAVVPQAALAAFEIMHDRLTAGRQFS